MTNKELQGLPTQDFLRLTLAMANYRDDLGIEYVIKTYEGGILRISDRSGGAGRCLFFAIRKDAAEEVLVALKFYKKESDHIPQNVLDTARTRKREFERNDGKRLS